MKKAVRIIAIFSILLIIAGCGNSLEESKATGTAKAEVPTASVESEDVISEVGEEEPETDIAKQDSALVGENAVDKQVTTPSAISINEIPAYSGDAYAIINNNVPFFNESDLSAESYEYYSDLDSLGRCGVCMASVGKDIMPTEERGEIGSVKPTGWHTVKYNDLIDGNYLYNRCHLIGFQLTGENANEKNLITGTRYLNVQGMLPFENMVADYVKETGNHVMYRVTPVFDGDNLVADGVLIEAESVEDKGNGILFHVFCYNVQPGIAIDYATGDSTEDGSTVAEAATDPLEETLEQNQEITPDAEQESQTLTVTPDENGAYAVNAKNGKIHMVGKCPATGEGNNAMKEPVYFGTYEEAEAYSVRIAPTQDKRKCGNCW